MDIEKDKSESHEKGIFARIKKVKHIEIIIAVVAVLIMLLIYFTTLGTGSGTKKNNAASEGKASYCQFLQDELQVLISSIKGAGDSKVLISWESSVELILAKTENNSQGSSSTSPVIVQGSGGSSPIVLKEIYPKAVGVLIICQGGNDPTIKINVIMAVSNLLDISPDKVIVYAMTK